MSVVADLSGALADTDPTVAASISREEDRQRTTLEMIASENFTSRAVLEAVGSVLTNKYAEGLPGRRYYGGCEFVDEVETLAIERAQTLFGADHANVQPHSGAQANMAVYFSVLKPGDTVMGMRLDQGGHLTHGSHVNFSGKLFEFVSYGVDRESETIDYEEMARLAEEHRPKLIVTGATAYPRIIDFQRAREIADGIGAMHMADMAHIAGLVAAGVHPTPVGHAQLITSSTHKTLRGPRGGLVLCDADYARQVDRGVFPVAQGGPLMHVIAGKAVAARRSLDRGVPCLLAADRGERAHPRRDARRRGAARRQRWHRQPPAARRRDTEGPDRPERRGRARPRGHRRQQERDPLRRAAARDRLGHPHRHPRAHIARTGVGRGCAASAS